MTTETGANPGGGTNPTAGRGPGGPGGTGPGIGSAGRGGRGGRGSNRSHNRGQMNPQAIAAAAAKKRAAAFKGEDPDMASHVFTCFNEAADPKQFDKTLAALERYSAKSLKHPGDMSPIFEDLTEPNLEAPVDLTDEELKINGESKLRRWDKQYDRYEARLSTLQDNLKALYAVTWGQCSPAMQAKVMTLQGYSTNRFLPFL